MIKIANNALNNCHSIEEIVELCNNEFATDATPELIAAAYAIDAAEFSDDISDREVLEFHCEYLRDAGAKFDWSTAIQTAVEELNNFR